MKNECLVSVVVPVYMAEEYVENTLLNLLQQKYQNIEIICVDDASTDRSKSICENIRKSDSRVIVTSNIDEMGRPVTYNCGVEATRNRGLSIAKGKYVIFIDADDIIEKDMLVRMVKVAENNNLTVTLCSYSQIIDGKEIPCEGALESGIYSAREFSRAILDEIPWGIISCIGTKLYHREWLIEEKIYYNAKYKYNEDTAFMLEVILKTSKIGYINESLYKYLIRKSGSTMSSYRENMFETNVKVLDLLNSIFIKYKIQNEKKVQVLTRLYFIIIDSLVNDVKFATKHQYKLTCQKISAYKNFDEMCRLGRKGALNLKGYHKIILNLLSNKKFYELYAVLKIRQILKTKHILFKFHVIFWQMFYERKYRKKMNLNNVEVYMFHDINEKRTDEKNYSLNCKDFEQFIKELQVQTNICSVSEIEQQLCKNKNAVCITFDDVYSGVYEFAYPILKHYNIPFALFITTDYIGKVGYLSKSQLLEMAKDPLCIIGAHTCSHPMLRYARNYNTEIEDGKKILESIIHKRVDYFAYPYGSIWACSKKNINYVHKENFEMAFSTIYGSINKKNMYVKNFLPRIEAVREIENCKRRRG